AGLHEEHVTAHFGREVATVRVGRDSMVVTLDDGQRLEADATLAAYGTIPASGWATGVDEGIAVDDRLRAANLPGVYAAGSVAVHTARNRHRYRVDHWDAATAQGSHAARTLLHDLGRGEDPGPYVPSTGFTLILYRHAIAAYGVALPGAIQRQHLTGNPDAILTTFHDPADQAQTAAVGLAAGRELLALRRQLQRP
ncbi:MAG TPA: FAD-dependent oxidoreductase, partial [Pseudonocardiaceae bacterium]|nr:FAD-dependent oxidoreductase [Pseudonocardiaceae bacterium]